MCAECPRRIDECNDRKFATEPLRLNPKTGRFVSWDYVKKGESHGVQVTTAQTNRGGCNHRADGEHGFRIAGTGNIARHRKRVHAIDDGDCRLWSLRGSDPCGSDRRVSYALTAPVTAHARYNHRAARPILLLVMRVADAHGIRSRIARPAIDRNAPRGAANDPAALRGKFLGGETM